MTGFETDRGWAWIVCLGTFIGMFLETGMVKALGVMLPTLQEQFGSHMWVIGFVISLAPGVGAITCPLSGALTKYFSARPVAMCFGFISSMGFIVGSFATSATLFSIACLLSGFSIGVEAVLLGELAKFFDKRFSTANAIAQAGLSIGIIVIPPLTQLLLDTYGWRGCMLLIGVINLHLVATGVVLRQTNSVRRVSQYSRNTLRYGARIDNKNRHMGLIPTAKYMVHLLDLSLFKDPVFISMFVFHFGNGYCLAGWMIYLVPFAIDKGLPPKNAVSLSMFGGIGNLIGNMVFPLVIKRFSSSQIMISSSFLGCFAFLAYPTVTSYTGLICASISYGFSKLSAMLGAFQITKEEIAKESVTNAFAWCFVAYSAGSLLSGFLSGWIFDQTGSFTISFFILSGMSILSMCPEILRTVHSTISKRSFLPSCS